MATVNNKVVYTADVQNLLSGMKRIESQTASVQKSFGGLKSAIAGLAIGAFIQNTVQAGVALKNLSDSTGIAVRTLSGLQQAMIAAGGSAAKTIDGISDLTKNIGDAASGSGELQKAFAKVGVSLQDLRDLSEEDILKKTIAGLAAIPDAATRTATGMKIMGESIKGVDLVSVNRELATFTNRAVDNAKSLESVQRAQRNMGIALERIREAVIKAIGPLAEMIANLKPETIDRFVDALVKVGTAAAAIGALAVALNALNTTLKVLAPLAAALGSAFVLVKTGLLSAAGGAAVITGGLASLGKTAAITASILSRYSIPAFFSASGMTAKVAALGVTLTTLAKRFGFAKLAADSLSYGIGLTIGGLARAATGVALVASGVVLLNAAIKAAFDVDPIDAMATRLESLVRSTFPGLASGIDKVGAALGLAAAPSVQKERASVNKEAEAENAAEIKRLQNRSNALKGLDETSREVVDAEIERRKKLAAEYAKEARSIEEIVNGYKDSIKVNTERYNLDTKALGLSTKQVEIQNMKFEAERGFLSEMKTLQEQYNELKLRANAGEANAIKLIPQVKAAMESLADAYNMQVQSIDELVAARERAQAAQQFDLFKTKEEITLRNQLQDIMDDTAKLTMTDLEKKYYDIEKAAKASAKAAIEAEQARRGAPLSTTEINAYYAAALKGVEKLKKATADQQKQARSWSTGWKQAMNEYVDNATNAAKRAQDVFKKATSGMEDLIVNFAKTGKFEWKGFVQDMLETLLRSQIQGIFASMMNGVKGEIGGAFGGLGDILGSVFGGAGGGELGSSTNNPLYVKDVTGGSSIAAGIGGLTGSGQRPTSSASGGGILDTVKSIGSSVMSSVGTAVSSVTSGLGSVLGGAWDAVKSIGSSIGSFFGFAQGGLIPSNGPMLVGERGPEMISGASGRVVTPNNQLGGGTVNYYITANDARSFKEMIAADPSFLHAVVQHGAKSTPRR